MFPTRSIPWPAAFAALTLALLPAISQAEKPAKPGAGSDTLAYDIYELDSDGGAFSGFAADLDDFGTVVGSAVDNATGESFAACWDVVVAADGTVTSALRLLRGPTNTGASGLNNLGEVVGSIGGLHGLYWPSTGDDPLPLLPLNGDAASPTTGINDAGIISGWSIGSGNHPVIWRVTTDDNGNPIVLGPFLMPSVEGIAWDLSEADADGVVTVAGEAWDGELWAGVTWRVQLQSNGGILIDPQPTILQVGVNVSGINNTGVVCGDSSRPDWIATLWTETDQIPLARPRRFAKSSATDLNDAGVVVGWVGEDGSGFPWEAAVWAGPDARPVLLSSLLSPKSPFDVLRGDSAAINQAGVIVGYGWDGDDGLQQAFIAFPR